MQLQETSTMTAQEAVAKNIFLVRSIGNNNSPADLGNDIILTYFINEQHMKCAVDIFLENSKLTLVKRINVLKIALHKNDYKRKMIVYNYCVFKIKK